MKTPAGYVVRTTPASGTTWPHGQVVTLVPSLGPPPVNVPSLKRDTVPEATQALTDAGLTLGGTTFEYDTKIPSGEIVSWTPAITAPRGGAIDVVVSNGPPPTPLPDVTGKTEKAAKRILKDAGFAVTVEPGFSDTIAKGIVMSTTPPGGPNQEAPYGSPVTLTVSVGPETFACPDFFGLTLDEAKALAKSSGLRVSFVPVPGPGGPGDHVVSQLPAAGSTVHYDEIVALYYA